MERPPRDRPRRNAELASQIVSADVTSEDAFVRWRTRRTMGVAGGLATGRYRRAFPELRLACTRVGSRDQKASLRVRFRHRVDPIVERDTMCYSQDCRQSKNAGRVSLTYPELASAIRCGSAVLLRHDTPPSPSPPPAMIAITRLGGCEN
jgi:hypothetical protein